MRANLTLRREVRSRIQVTVRRTVRYQVRKFAKVKKIVRKLKLIKISKRFLVKQKVAIKISPRRERQVIKKSEIRGKSREQNSEEDLKVKKVVIVKSGDDQSKVGNLKVFRMNKTHDIARQAQKGRVENEITTICQNSRISQLVFSKLRHCWRWKRWWCVSNGKR